MPGPIQRSLLDRLTDEPATPGCSAEEFGQGVVRDLSDLVNTPRVNLDEVPERFTNVRTSILFYGLPRPGLLGKSKQDRERLAADLRDAILRHEPRLMSVVITPALKDADRDEQASMRPYAFRIRAVLRSDPLPTEIELGATLSRYPEAIRVVSGALEDAGDAAPGKEDGHAR